MLRRVPANMLSSTRIALRAAGHIVEHDAGAVLGAQDRFGGEADVFLPARALDGAHFAEPFGMREPFAQIVIGDVGCNIAGDIGSFVHDLLLRSDAARFAAPSMRKPRSPPARIKREPMSIYCCISVSS